MVKVLLLLLLLLLLLPLPTPSPSNPPPPSPSQITTNAAPTVGSGSKHVTCDPSVTCDRCVTCDHPLLRCSCYTLWCGFVIDACKTVQWDDQSRTV